MRYGLLLILVLSACSSLKKEKEVSATAYLSEALSSSANPDPKVKPFGYKTIYQQGSPDSFIDDEGVLQVDFPENQFGPQTSGYNFSSDLKPSPSKTISYDVWVPEDFDFVQGGKLPGLCGGNSATGGHKATGNNGFSVRVMWRKEGRLVSYVYHVDQKTEYGDDFSWRQSGKDVFLTPNQWHHIKLQVTVNDPKKKNGIVESYFDGVRVSKIQDLRFRTVSDFEVDKICFNTFFGGSSQGWAPKSRQHMQIRNLKVE